MDKHVSIIAVPW